MSDQILSAMEREKREREERERDVIKEVANETFMVPVRGLIIIFVSSPLEGPPWPRIYGIKTSL